MKKVFFVLIFVSLTISRACVFAMGQDSNNVIQLQQERQQEDAFIAGKDAELDDLEDRIVRLEQLARLLEGLRARNRFDKGSAENKSNS